MTTKAIKQRALSITAATLLAAGVLFSASPAHAGVDISVKTTDDNPGGSAHFNDLGEYFNVCDDQVDGKRAVAWLEWYSGGFFHSAKVEDANGGNNGCVLYPYDIEIAEGNTVWLTVCLQDGANGTPVFCRTQSGTA
ncbi:hypothetical protein AB0B31_41585 [Catellatospora citrea]|uniref:hypothetical protein n=1 Tax=Catellatospora citrea TaxID=53366 RepID=UPI003407D762